MVQNGAQINVDGRLLAVAGNSVGGNMAAAVSLMVRAKGAPAPGEQVLFWSVATANFETASYDELELYLSSYSGVDMTLRAAGFCFPPPDGRSPDKPSATKCVHNAAAGGRVIQRQGLLRRPDLTSATLTQRRAPAVARQEAQLHEWPLPGEGLDYVDDGFGSLCKAFHSNPLEPVEVF